MLLDRQKGRPDGAAGPAARSSIVTGRRLMRPTPAANDNRAPRRDGFMPRILLIGALAALVGVVMSLN